MIVKGFRFGMILQLAVGPVCLFIFKTGSTKGFLSAELGVLAVTLIDALFIILALLGIASAITKEKVKSIFKVCGSLVVALFGLKAIIEVIGLETIPEFNIIGGFSIEDSFVEGVILTASNPLTILFWAGVFSAKIADEEIKKKDSYLFGFGCVLSTFIFLTVAALAGSITQRFLPNIVITVLNLLVGIVLMLFAVRILLKKV